MWGEGRFPLDTQLCPCHTSRLDHTRLHAHANSQPYLLYKSPLSRHSPQLEGGAQLPTSSHATATSKSQYTLHPDSKWGSPHKF